jgi:hypothetical protein
MEQIMTSQLVRYEAARYALAECQRVDEVKDIRDKAEAMAAYARQAKDTELVQWATEIKVRAERKAGELLTAMAERGERAQQGDGPKFDPANSSIAELSSARPATLADLGVNKRESHRWQSLASMSEEHFETAVATAKDTAGQVTTAFMLREAAKARPQGKAPAGAKADAMREELKAAKERGVSMLETYARLTLTAVRAQDSFTEQERSLLAELMDAIAAVTA